jgi:peptidyl-dipeptidase Dcp
MILLTFSACKQKKSDMPDPNNPFFSDFKTPYEVPDFDAIKEEHYMPAYRYAIEVHNDEISVIINNAEPPDFFNTIEALDKSGALLTKIENVFGNLNSAHTNDLLQSIAKEKAPLISEHYDDIRLNPNLFSRIKEVYDKSASLDLNDEQKMLLEKTYKDFVRGGVNLDPDDQSRLREINKELSVLTLKFGENVLKEINDFKLVIENSQDLSGLPEPVIRSAIELAKEAGMEGKWIFTVQKPSMIPFLQYSDKRDLREKIFKAYINLGNNDTEQDNKDIISRIVNLRLEKAKMLGYTNHSSFVLAENMAKKPEEVLDFLKKLWDPAIMVAQNEANELQKFIAREDGTFKLEPWDWWYYSEKLRKEKYDLDDELLRPYFKLNNVLNGVFDVCNKLYGLKFTERFDIPKYQDDVRVFEVQE